MSEEQQRESLSAKFKRTGALPKPEDNASAAAPSVANILTGTLKEKSITWLLQAADHYEATGRLQIGAALYTCYIEFGLGRPINARSPLNKGTDAILEIFTWPDGKVTFIEGVQPEAPTVEESVHQIIKQGEAFIEHMQFLESYAISEVSFLQRAPGRLTPEELEKRLLEGMPLGLTVQKEFYGNVYGTLNLKDVADKMGLSQARWMAIVVNLLKLGLFLTPEGNSVVNADRPPVPAPSSQTRDMLSTGQAWLGAMGAPADPAASAAPAAPPGGGAIPNQPFTMTPTGMEPAPGAAPYASPVGLAPAPAPPAPALPPGAMAPPAAAAMEWTPVQPTTTPGLDWNPTTTGAQQILTAPSPSQPLAPAPSQPMAPAPSQPTRAPHPQPSLDAWVNTGTHQIQPPPPPPVPPQHVFDKLAEETAKIADAAASTGSTPGFPGSPAPFNPAPAPSAPTTQTLPPPTPVAPALAETVAPPVEVAAPVAPPAEPERTEISLGVPTEEFGFSSSASESINSLLRRKDTSILHYDAFQYFLEREFTSAYRFGTAFTLILFCVRLENDETSTLPLPALSMITEAVDRIKREVDILGHVGDKAFGIILPQVVANQACNLADRITIDLPKMAPGLVQYRPIVHFGIASVPQDATELLMLVAAARKAMLEAASKNASRVMFQEIGN